jgi:serine/threonine-protein kinase
MRSRDFRPGLRLGPYELTRELGRGGFAAVWEAKRSGMRGFEVNVAIKLIHVDEHTDPSFEAMFIDEAKLVAGITHPNVVRIFELGREGDTLYQVMECVRGTSLHLLRNRAKRAGTPLPVGLVMHVLAETCAGLHAAHELVRDGKHLEVVHRDVSPQNILISDGGIVKLIDFGVAKANDRLAADTTEGFAKGKLRYMAPEQAVGQKSDRRADLWAVGAVAFDLIEGHPPHDGYNDLARLFKLLEATPPELTAPVPAPIAAVIRKCLARSPDDRWSTAAELRAAIDAALAASDVRVTTSDVARWVAELEAAPDDEPSEGEALRARLVRGSARERVATVTNEHQAPPPSAPPSAGLEPGEPLPVVAPPAKERPAAPLRLAIAAGLGTAVVVAAVWVVAFSGKREPPPAAVAASPPSASATVAAPSAAPTEIASAPSFTPTPLASELADVAPSSTPRSRAAPRPATKPKITPAASVTPGPAATTARPRYDDTIQ